MSGMASVSVVSVLSVAVLVAPGVSAFGRSLPGAVGGPPMSCEVTAKSAPPFVAPSPYPSAAPYTGNFWHGHEKLWTMLRADGTWHSLPRNADGFRQKIFWWSPGFDGRVEASPNLFVTGRRLDEPGSFVRMTPATNARHDDFGGWAILTGIDVPSAGCWEFTGTYRGESVTFVVSVQDRPDD